MVFPLVSIIRFRRKSLVRAIILALGAFALSLRLGGFPDIDKLHSSQWEMVPVVMASWSIVETVRCTGKTWSLYYIGVLMLLYSEVMILGMAVVLLFYP